MTDDEQDIDLGRLREAIDERLTQAGTTTGPDADAAVQRELVDLIEDYDRRSAGRSAAMRRTIFETEAAISSLSHATDAQTLLQSVQSGAAEIAGAEVRLTETTDGDSPEAGRRNAGLVLPIRLADRIVAVLELDDPGDDIVRSALVSYTDLAALLLENAAWHGRELRQLEIVGRLGNPGITADERAQTPRPPVGTPANLTRREAEIYHLLLTGMANRDIAEQLYVSVETVRSHVKRILAKAGARNRAELIARSS